MSPRLALMIGGVAGFLFGLLSTVFPTALGGPGLDTSNAAIAATRDVGVTNIGVGVINWTARNAAGKVLRGLLVGNVVIQALELVVNGYEIATGLIPTQTAGGLLVHLVLGAVFVLAMRSPTVRA